MNTFKLKLVLSAIIVNLATGAVLHGLTYAVSPTYPLRKFLMLCAIAHLLSMSLTFFLIGGIHTYEDTRRAMRSTNKRRYVQKEA
jgi:multisubunit Na+/H+ antiporter MnhC subunit